MSRPTLLASLLLLGLTGCPTPPRIPLPDGPPPEYEPPRGYTPDHNIDGRPDAAPEDDEDEDDAATPAPAPPTPATSEAAPASEVKPPQPDDSASPADGAPDNTPLPPAPGK